MTMRNPEVLIPAQAEGGQKDFEYEYACRSAEEAKQYFQRCKDRLMDINNWHNIGGAPSAIFKITDNYGKELHIKATISQYIKIDVPGPGPAASGGNDWVQIEHVISGKLNDNEEYAAIRVRPSAAPDKAGATIMHFFSDKATSTFILKRMGNTITIQYAGRNEVANKKADVLIDQVRNAVVATTARMGFSDVQWKSLIKGIIGLHQ